MCDFFGWKMTLTPISVLANHAVCDCVIFLDPAGQQIVVLSSRKPYGHPFIITAAQHHNLPPPPPTYLHIRQLVIIFGFTRCIRFLFSDSDGDQLVSAARRNYVDVEYPANCVPCFVGENIMADHTQNQSFARNNQPT